MHLRNGQDLTLTTDGSGNGRDTIPCGWAGLPNAVKPDDVIYLADGSIRLRVREAGNREVLMPRRDRRHRGVAPGDRTCPASRPSRPRSTSPTSTGSTSRSTTASTCWRCRSSARASDLDPVHARLEERGEDIPVIAKIEKREAADAAEEIVQAAAASWSRAATSASRCRSRACPQIQKRLLSLAGRYSKPSITATQMLASMVRSTRPTRAEATDVANAVYDGTDALMLSEETAIGELSDRGGADDGADRRGDREAPPLRGMASHAHPPRRARRRRHGLLRRGRRPRTSSTSSVLVVPTRSGRTPRLVSAHRPRVPVLALSERLATVRRVNLLFGVRSALHEEPPSLDELLASSALRARELGFARTGDLIGITAGLAGQGLGTNLLEVHRVP